MLPTDNDHWTCELPAAALKIDASVLDTLLELKLEGQIGINMTFSVKKKCFCMRDIIIIFWGATAMHYLMHRFGIF